jgi:alpha-L-arabinofuranosidase
MFLALLLLAAPAHATDEMLIYSDRFHNGWGDNWSWMPRYPTNNPVYAGSNSMACVPSGTWQAWWLKAGTSVDTTIYTNVSFWLNGSAAGGQSIVVSGELGGSGLSGIWVTAPTNTWQQITIPLATLGINNKTNLTGFQFGNGNSTQPFYIDDVRLVAAPAPATVHVSVLANQTVRKVDGKVFGINQVAWDGNVNTPATAAVMNDIGATCLRWPGGSWGDGYHWTNENWMAGATSPRYWGSFSPDFIALATNLHAQAFIIVNYGTSTPEEAAYGVRMFNVTNRCNFKYWEIGNEVGGFWEWDWNTNAPFKDHDPWTYAMRFTNYYAQMKAADPTIKIGAVADTTEDGTVNNYDHPVVNPRTGVTHYGWTPVMLTYLRSNNCLPDFLIEHNYGPTAGDTQDLLWSRGWALDAANLRQMLNDYLGNAATNVTLEITENGMGGDKQNCSLPGGLFYADSIGQVLQTEFNSRLWWDTRNGINSLGDSDPAFYGWRTNGSGNFISDGGIVYGLGGVGSAYPTYYCAKLMPHFARDGDTVVSAASDWPLLATYAVKRTNGTLTLLVINKSSSSNLTASFSLSGYLPFTNATVYSYGIPQDEAARTGVGSPDIQTNTTGFQSLSLTFAPFSASVVELSAANQPPPTPANLVATASSAAVALTWSPATAADSYIIRRSSTSGGSYSNVATGVTATNYLDTGLANAVTYYYVVAATNVYGVSSNSAEVSATPNDMRAYYALEGNALDTSGNGFNGTANAVSYVAGKVGAQAAQFNGSSSYVAIPRSITDDFTVALWVKTTDTAGSGGAQWWAGKGLVDGEVNGGGADWGTAIVNGKFAFGVGSSSGDTTIASSVSVNDGTWHHLAATRNNTSGAMQVYVDGVLRGSGSGPTGSRTWPPNLRIGSLQTANNVLNGTLDDVRLYSRILTADEISAIVTPRPAAPGSLVAVADNGRVVLSWSAAATATSYFIKRSTTSGSGYTSIATNASLTFTNTGLNNGTTYYYVVSGVNASGEGANSTEASATPVAPPPAPTNIVAIAGDSSVALSWSASATAANYCVKRSLTSGSGYTTIATNTSLAFTNTGLLNGTAYFYVVSALNASGESSDSAQVSARPTSSAPVALVVTSASGQIQLAWPVDHTGWQLQSQTNSPGLGLSTNWVNVAGSEQTNRVTVPLSTTDGSVFFRLLRP